MKKIFLIPLALLLAMSLVAVTCPGPAQAKPKVIELIASYPLPGKGVVSECLWYFCDYVEKNTGGRVHFKRYPSGQLASHGEHLELVGSGGADVATLLPSLFPDQLHFTAMQHEQLTDVETATKNLYHIWFENPETAPFFEKEWTKRNVKFLNITGLGEIGFLLTYKPVKTLADLKGIKMGTLTDDPYMKEFGMHSQVVKVPDIYEALSRGQVQGFMLSASAFMDYKHYETSKTYLDLGLALVTGHIFMNLDTYKKLPPDIQKVFVEGGKETMAYSITAGIREVKKALQTFKSAGLEVNSLPKDEQKLHFQRFFAEWEAEWLQRAKGKGLTEQSKKVLKVYKKLLGPELFQ